MTAANLATLANLNQQSIAREDLNLRQLQGGTQADQNQLAIDRVRLEASQGFQNAQAALSQQQARDKLAQDQLNAQRDLTHALNDLTKQMQKLADQQKQAQIKAVVDAVKAQFAAARDLEKQDRDLAKQSAAVGKAAGDAISKAFADEQKRAKDQADQERAAQQKFFDARIQEGIERGRDPEGKFRTQAERDFDEQGKARREEQRQAEKTHLEEGDRIRREIENNKLLKQIAGKLDRPNVAIGPTTVQETGKDLITKAAQVAQQRLRV
jgi:hypothetical protein